MSLEEIHFDEAWYLCRGFLFSRAWGEVKLRERRCDNFPMFWCSWVPCGFMCLKIVCLFLDLG